MPGAVDPLTGKPLPAAPQKPVKKLEAAARRLTRALRMMEEKSDAVTH